MLSFSSEAGVHGGAGAGPGRGQGWARAGRAGARRGDGHAQRAQLDGQRLPDDSGIGGCVVRPRGPSNT
jgi:hypothetical protein